jgi:hypothetical protein
MSAHLCLIIQVFDGKPQVTGASIFSEPAESLTSTAGEHYAGLFEAFGEYAKARQDILDSLKSSPKRFGWLYQYFEELEG